MNYWQYECMIKNECGVQELRSGVVTGKTIYEAFISIFEFYRGKILEIKLTQFSEDEKVIEF